MAHTSGDAIELPLRGRAVAAPSRPSLQVVIADAQGLVRAGIRALLERSPDISVAGEAATGDDALAVARRARPDVVLMDVALPGLDAHEATRQIVAGAPEGATRVLMLMTAGDDDAVFAALRAGAAGLLLKEARPEDLADACRAVASGGALLSPRLAGRLVRDFLSRPERLTSTSAQLDELTAREREVVALVARGLSNEEIAEELVVTRATAKTHVSRAMRKLCARDRAQLVVMAYESGLVRPGPARIEAPAAPLMAVARPVPHPPRGGRWQPLAA